MIINSFDEDKVKILVDRTDLENAGISAVSCLSDFEPFLSWLQKKLNVTIKDYFIATFNYQIFSIILFSS
ncbi:MAG: hypothetical protein IJ867_00735 [Clostridia bacterium]|nr:hypothetical protein [Clostridia bacterium]